MFENVDLILVHKIDINISSGLGIISCLFVLFLIYTRTIPEMKNYKRILVQGCVIDLFFAIATLFAAPIIVLEGSFAYLIVNNFLSNLTHTWRFYATVIWIFVFTLLVPSCPVQFVYRYFVFCRNTKVKILHYVEFLFISISFAFIYSILVFIACFPQDSDLEETNQAIGYLFINADSSLDIKIGLVADANTRLMQVILCINFATDIISYGAIFWSSYKLYKFFKECEQYISKSNREAQNQLTTALICQILSPIIFNMLPLVYIVTTLFLGISDSRLSIVLNLGFSWIPFINCCTTIYFVLPYKQGAKEILFGKCFKANETGQEMRTAINVRTVQRLKIFIEEVITSRF